MDTTLRLVWFCCGLVWLLRWLGENFWKELQVRCRRTAVFHFNGRCLTSFSFHFTAMDPWTLNWLHVLVLETSHRTPIFLGNLHELQLRFFWVKNRTPWLANFVYRFSLRGWFRTSWSFWALHFDICGAHLVNNFSWKGPVSLRTINFKLKGWRSLTVTSGWGGIQRKTSRRNFKLRGPRFWTRTSPWRNFDFSTRRNIVRKFWHLKGSSGTNFILWIFDFQDFEINSKWYFKTHFLDPDCELHNGRPESDEELGGEANGQLSTSVPAVPPRVLLFFLGRQNSPQTFGPRTSHG